MHDELLKSIEYLYCTDEKEFKDFDRLPNYPDAVFSDMVSNVLDKLEALLTYSYNMETIEEHELNCHLIKGESYSPDIRNHTDKLETFKFIRHEVNWNSRVTPVFNDNKHNSHSLNCNLHLPTKEVELKLLKLREEENKRASDPNYELKKKIGETESMLYSLKIELNSKLNKLETLEDTQ